MPSEQPDFAKPENNKYPGYRLGYPEEGLGSMAGFWRRIGGLVLDWFMALAAGNVFFGGDPVAIGLLFIGITAVCAVLFGGSFGHLVFGMRLSRLDGSAPGLWRPVVRQVLLSLVLPAAVWDTDHRGGHDIITGLALRVTR